MIVKIMSKTLIGYLFCGLQNIAHMGGPDGVSGAPNLPNCFRRCILHILTNEKSNIYQPHYELISEKKNWFEETPREHIVQLFAMFFQVLAYYIYDITNSTFK